MQKEVEQLDLEVRSLPPDDVGDDIDNGGEEEELLGDYVLNVI